jgi:hypothetical protein
MWFLATDKLVRSDDLADYLRFVQKLLYPAPGDDTRIRKLRTFLEHDHARAHVTCFWRGGFGETAPQIPLTFKSVIAAPPSDIETDFATINSAT